MNKHLPLVPDHAKGRETQSTGCGYQNTPIEGVPVVATSVSLGGVQDRRWKDNGADGWTEGLELNIRTKGAGAMHTIRDPYIAETLAAQLLVGAIDLRKALERGQAYSEEVLNGAGA